MTIRTSDSHPIRVDWLPRGLAGMPGRLGMTFGPGKCGPSAFGGAWKRDLPSDLDRLKDHYQADCLVTLLEEPELKALEMGSLFKEALGRGMEVYWWSWADATAPDSESAMSALVDEILCRVFNGDRVVVHCRGGLGRTGTVVDSCLRALDYTWEETIGLVREARQGAVETRDQERFVRAYDRRWTPASPSLRDKPRRSSLWKYLEEMGGLPKFTPHRSDPNILSAKRADKPRIFHFTNDPSLLPQTEQEVIQEFVRCFDFAKDESPPHTVLDAIVDRAVRNQKLDIKPELAALALKRLLSKSNPWPADVDRPDKPQEFPHLLNGARRLFLIAEASPQNEVEFSDELRQSIKDAIWFDDPLDRFAIRETGRASWALHDAMQICALRFDGYRYRELYKPSEEGLLRSLAITAHLERHADYEFHCPFDLLTSFFLVQRALGGWGAEQSSEKSTIRRVYLELFILTHDLYVPPRFAMTDAGSAYYLWRWGYQPVAAPFVEMAREELRTVDFKGPRAHL